MNRYFVSHDFGFHLASKYDHCLSMIRQRFRTSIISLSSANTFEWHRACKLHLVVIKDVKSGVWQLALGFVKTAHHEISGSIGVIEISWAVVNMEELACLRHGAKQWISNCVRPFSFC